MPTSTTEPRQESHDALASLRIDRTANEHAGGSFRKWMLALVVILIGIGGWFGYRWATADGQSSNGSPWVPSMMRNRVEVRLASVTVQKGRSADAVVVATGYLESRRQAKIGARAAGRIATVTFEEGDPVSKGELLAELEHRDLDASLTAAKASVVRAQAALAEQQIAIEEALVNKNRMERMRESNSVAASEYDQARFAHQSAIARRDSLAADIALAEAQLNQTEQLRENMFIRAPFDGTVISKDAEVGESILPGGMGGGSGRGSVATIADLDHLEIEVDVQEDFISRVIEGQEAEISVDAVQDKKYHGVVRKIIPMGDRARATIKVKVTIRDADKLLFPEMAGTVFFLPTEEKQDVSDEPRTFCPASAISVNDSGRQFVWIVDADKLAQKLEVESGERNDDRVEILRGLVGSERVVVNPENLQVGTPVTVLD